VYATPAFISTLRTSTAIADHVPVDFELQGCPINKAQLLEVVGALLAGRRPTIPRHSVCVDCKSAGIPCVMVARGVPCLGPVTQAGCGALCPLYARGCFACFGPKEQANIAALAAHWRELGVDDPGLARAFRGINANTPEFRKQATLHE
jgi:coenzyme F420-reducing hydrogenase gamma subunit